jgi:orotate phosphoribosyltransferase
MKNIDDLVDSASDELNVSRETASWLVERSGAGATPIPSTPTGGPHDIHVDWSAIGRDSARLHHLGAAMADLLSKQGEDIDLTIGIEKAGAPLATTVAQELETDLGTYAPTKHQWDDDDDATSDGSFSRNFAQIRNRDCFIVDDTITSGKTMSETISAIRQQGGNPVACVVLADKRGVEDIQGVPVYSLLQVIRVGSDDDAE